MAAGWDEGGWGSHPAPPVAQGTVTSAPGATSQGSWVCLELSQHSHPTPAPECLQGTALEHSMITSWDLPGGQEVTSVLVWHPEARFTRREMHGFVSSSKGKTPSQVKLAPCTIRVVSLLCTIPSSPCCSPKCIPGKPPKAPQTWKSDTLQAHRVGSRWAPSPAELSFSNGPRWSLPWDGLVGWILGRNGEVGWSNQHFTMWGKIKPPPQDDVHHGGFTADHNQAT